MSERTNVSIWQSQLMSSFRNYHIIQTFESFAQSTAFSLESFVRPLQPTTASKGLVLRLIPRLFFDSSHPFPISLTEKMKFIANLM